MTSAASIAMEMSAVVLGAGAVAAAFIKYRQSRLAELALEQPSHPPKLWRDLARHLAGALKPNSPKELEQLRADLLHAGRGGQDELHRYLEERVVYLLGGCTAALILMFSVGGKVGLLLMLIGLYAGIAGPQKLLHQRANRRREDIARHLPSAIDLLMTSIDAGLSINQAIGRVAREQARSAPVLSQETAITSSEIEAGVPLPDALHRMARRVDLDDMTGLCGVIAQAHELGAPIVETLNDYAESARRMRMAKLEERAGKLVIRLTFPLAMFLLPAAMIAILGSPGIQLMKALGQ